MFSNCAYDLVDIMIEIDEAFLEYLLSSYHLDRATLSSLIDELGDHWSEEPQEFVQRRHSELQTLGFKNDEIYRRILHEMNGRRFGSSQLSQRQIRRMIYG